MLEEIDAYETGDGLDFRRKQCSCPQRLLSLTHDLRTEEESLHDGMPERLQRV